jgi:nucleotide-binding universal stress UspA family protein
MKKLSPKRKTVNRKRTVSSAAKKSVRHDKSLIGLQSILVPIDFSDNSKKALRYAIPFAQQFKASLTLMYVVEPTIYPSDFGFGQVGFPNVEKELQEKATEEMRQLIATLIPSTVQSYSVVDSGIPFVEITSYAQKKNVDLIIVATHGTTGVEHILFGSTAEKIIRKSPCPVLVIRAEEHDFIDERV